MSRIGTPEGKGMELLLEIFEVMLIILQYVYTAGSSEAGPKEP